MPGIVVFKRRWSIGSDDLVVPAGFLVVLHIVWIIVLGIILGVVNFDPNAECSVNLQEHVLGYLVILSCCVLSEGAISFVAMRGTILDPTPRSSMQYLLYIRLGILLVEVAWLVVGVVWFSQHFNSCKAVVAKRAVLGIIVCNWVIMFTVFISLWCAFDTAGRSWVKMKRYQESLKEREHRPGTKSRKSGSRRRNWRHRYSYHAALSVEGVRRKALRAYEESWDRRCKILFCCVKEDRHRNSFTEVAKLFTEFFRDLDVVPSDIVAGLVLLRKHQKLRRKCIVSQGTNDVYQFLSGVAITPGTRFLRLKDPSELRDYKKVVHYMKFALAAYGWPMYMKLNSGTGLCKIMSELKCCCCCCCSDKAEGPTLRGDNCCNCNYAAMRKLTGMHDVDIIYATYHVDIGETPFFVAVDHDNRTVVISIRGTLSLQDVMTDLKADAEILPVDPPKEDWLGHCGIVHAAGYIKKKIKEEMLLSKAFGWDLEKGTQEYELVLVGHSLGAGAAAILAILLRPEYPTLTCFAYSPPGGLISATCVEETKSFITSVVVGKDVVPRIGLHQLESLRQDLINVIKKSKDPKWKVISGMMCCCGSDDEQTIESDATGMLEMYDNMKQEKESRYFLHPSDSQIALTTHTPLYPPGRIIHVVRNHPKKTERSCKSPQPVYQAIWVENMDLDEVLISPTMINDHMPDNVMEALEKVLTKVSPAKPSRKFSEAERRAMLSEPNADNDIPDGPVLCSANHVFLESGFVPSTAANTSLLEDFNRTNNMYRTAPNLSSWEGPGAERPVVEEEIIREVVAEKYDTFPPRPRLSLRLNFHSDDWVGNAPLASPETLSTMSSYDSLSSVGSKRYSYTKLTAGVPKMAPIQQSPTNRHSHPEGYCYFMHRPSPVEYGDSPERECAFGILNANDTNKRHSFPMTTPSPKINETIILNQSPLICPNVPSEVQETDIDEVCEEPIKPVYVDKDNMTPVYVDEDNIKHVYADNEDLKPVHVSDNVDVLNIKPPSGFSEIEPPILESASIPRDKNQLSPVCNKDLNPLDMGPGYIINDKGQTSPDMPTNTEPNSTDLHIEIEKLADKLVKTTLDGILIEQNYERNPNVPNDNGVVNRNIIDVGETVIDIEGPAHYIETVPDHIYLRHSPDSVCSGKQFIYDNIQEHYSAAGRGYPHGAYMNDSSMNQSTSNSDICEEPEQFDHTSLEDSVNIRTSDILFSAVDDNKLPCFGIGYEIPSNEDLEKHKLLFEEDSYIGLDSTRKLSAQNSTDRVVLSDLINGFENASLAESHV